MCFHSLQYNVYIRVYVFVSTWVASQSVHVTFLKYNESMNYNVGSNGINELPPFSSRMNVLRQLRRDTIASGFWPRPSDLAFNWKCKELWWSADLYNFLSFFLYNCRSRCCCVAKYVSFWTLKIYRLSNQSSISLLLRFVKLRCQYVLLLVHMFT